MLSWLWPAAEHSGRVPDRPGPGLPALGRQNQERRADACGARLQQRPRRVRLSGVHQSGRSGAELHWRQCCGHFWPDLEPLEWPASTRQARGTREEGEGGWGRGKGWPDTVEIRTLRNDVAEWRHFSWSAFFSMTMSFGQSQNKMSSRTANSVFLVHN